MSESKCNICEQKLILDEENICAQCELSKDNGSNSVAPTNLRRSTRNNGEHSVRFVLETGPEYDHSKEPLIEMYSDDVTLDLVKTEPTYSEDNERKLTKKKKKHGVKKKPGGLNRWVFCDMCPKGFVKAADLVAHRLSHNGDENTDETPLPFKCTVCDRSFAKQSLLKPHMITHTSDAPFKCGICAKRFKRNTTLIRHLKSAHSEVGPYQCSLCDYSAAKKAKIKTHMRKHHNGQPFQSFQCVECGKTLSKSSSLKTHMRMHTGERPYPCTICDYRCSQKGQLKRHLQVHTGEKPFECDICGKRVSDGHSLKAHKLIHTGEKPLACYICGKRFRRPGPLKVHIMYHNKDMRHFCPHCKFGSPYPYKLRIHIETVHSNETPYECDMCGKKYKTKGNLSKHKRGIRGSCQGADGPVNFSKQPTLKKEKNKYKPEMIPLSNQGADTNRFSFMQFTEQPHVNSTFKQYSEQAVHMKPKDTMSHSHYQEPTLPTLPIQSGLQSGLQSMTAALQTYQNPTQNLFDVGVINSNSQYHGIFIHPNSLNTQRSFHRDPAQGFIS